MMNDEIKKMIDADIELNEYSDAISATAYNIAKGIEKLINKHSDNIKYKNQWLEGKIMKWYTENGRDPKFAEFFEIKELRGINK